MVLKTGVPPGKNGKHIMFLIFTVFAAEMVEKKRASPPAKAENNTTLIFTVFTADMVEEKGSKRLSVKNGKQQIVIVNFYRFYCEDASGTGRKLEDLCKQTGLMLQPFGLFLYSGGVDPSYHIGACALFDKRSLMFDQHLKDF